MARFVIAKLKFGSEWFEKRYAYLPWWGSLWFNTPHHKVLSHYGDHYDKYVVTSGHWDAGWPMKEPTPPVKFLESLLKVISILVELA